MNLSDEFRSHGFSGLAVVLIVVDVGGQTVLQCPEGSNEGHWKDDYAFDEGEGEGESQVMRGVPMNARLKSQKILIVHQYYYIFTHLRNCSIIIQLLMLRTLQENAHPLESTPILTSQLPIFATQPQQPSELGATDVQQCKELIEGIINCQPTLSNKLEKIIERVEERTYNKGIGYFNAKNLLFLEYLIQIQFYQLFKINAVDLTNGAGLDLYKRLVYLKTLLMKLSPVEKKLEYQKNKLLKVSDLVAVKSDNLRKAQQEEEAAEEQEVDEVEEDVQENGEVQKGGSDSEDDALAYQPRPQSLMLVKKKKEETVGKEGKYVAPKISATLSKEDKMKRRQELQQERRKTHLIRKYRDDLMQDDEAREQGVQNEVAEKIKRKFREKTSIEEDGFVRFPDSKKDKFWKKQLIQRHNKTDQLKDTLKQVEMVGQIYRSQVQEQLKSDQIFQQRESHRPSNSHKTGTKKQKRE